MAKGISEEGCGCGSCCTKKLVVRDAEGGGTLAIFTIEVPEKYCCEDHNPDVWASLFQKTIEQHLELIRKEVSDVLSLDARLCEYYKDGNIIPQ